ncbi:hypothetical protein STEG23_018041 [Scotinomys teguina]
MPALSRSVIGSSNVSQQFILLSNQPHPQVFIEMSHWSGSKPLAQHHHQILTKTPRESPMDRLVILKSGKSRKCVRSYLPDGSYGDGDQTRPSQQELGYRLGFELWLSLWGA